MRLRPALVAAAIRAGLCAVVAGCGTLALAQAPVAGHGGHAGHPSAGAAKSAAARPALGASAAVDADGRLWAVRKEGEHVVLQHSTDRGGSWSAPQPVNTVAEPVAADGDNRPKIAVADGAIYVSWTSPGARPYSGDIRFARSLDGGASFEAPRTINADRQPITHRFDALGVDGRGNVFLAWIDKRDLEAARADGRPYRGAALYLAVSRDRGASFDGDRRLHDHSCECCRIALAPRADGGADLMWRQIFEPNIRDHALTRVDADGRPQALRRATVDGWAIDACPHHGPSLARDGRGRLHAVWFTQGPGREGVHYGRLRETGGEGEVDGERRVGGPAAAHADLAVRGEQVAIAWKEFDGERTVLRALRSDDGGEHFRELTLFAVDGPSGQPQLLVDDRGFLVFWHTRERPLALVALP